MELRHLQKRLHDHFRELRAAREQAGSASTVFGLEHPLAETEVTEARAALARAYAECAPSRDHDLVWVVHATEVGYDFRGTEYWQSFEEVTPGWAESGDRYFIRDCFRRFHRDYGGAQPVGAWAKNFTIICWPITNAVLPRDLQSHLARILYDLRHVITEHELDQPGALGALIAGRSPTASSRFQQLAQEPVFLGRVAADLLLHGTEGRYTNLEESALLRISHDLHAEQRARAWLGRAQASAQHQYRSRRQGSSDAQSSTNATRAQPGLGPRFRLRPSAGEWTPFAKFPDFSSLVGRLPGVVKALSSTRCRVRGSKGQWKPGGWLLLRESPPVKLQKWPCPEVPLLEFEASTAELELLNRTECLPHPGPLWLFKVGASGWATLLHRPNLRSGSHYVLLTPEGTSVNLPEAVARPTGVACDGVTAVEIEMPESIPGELAAELQRLGLGLASTTRLWPAGMAPADWDGEGSAEWLITDRPIVGIQSDVDVQCYRLALGFHELEAMPRAPGQPVFVELPPLPIGVHKVEIRTETIDEAEEIFSLTACVRTPSSGSTFSDHRSPLQVIMDPVSPTLDALWEHTARLEIHGPTGCPVRCRMQLHPDRNDRTPVIAEISNLAMPTSHQDWQRSFDRSCRTQRAVLNAYEVARAATLVFDAGAFGHAEIFVDRDLPPLRWQVARTASSYEGTLRDDTGNEAAPAVTHAAFETPDDFRSVNLPEAVMEPTVEFQAGLYVAASGSHRRTIAIYHGSTGLEDLVATPWPVTDRRDGPSLISLARAVDDWASARLLGDLRGEFSTANVLTSLTGRLFGLIGGRCWLELEEDDQMRVESIPTSEVVDRHIGSKLDRYRHKTADFTPLDRARFLRHAYFGIEETARPAKENPSRLDSWLAEFALRLASASPCLQGWAGANFGEGVLQLLGEHAPLARAARWMVHVTVDQDMETPTSRSPFGRWSWV